MRKISGPKNFSLLRSDAVAEEGANGYNDVWQKSDVRIVEEETYKETRKEEWHETDHDTTRTDSGQYGGKISGKNL